MPTGVPLLGSVAAGLLEHGRDLLAGQLPEPNVLAEIARHACAVWEQGQEPARARAELLALAQASSEEVRRQVGEAVAGAAAGQPTEVREALADYLLLVPSTIRHSLGRPGESCRAASPSARTVQEGAPLLSFLPAARPLFRPGSRLLCLPDWELVELLGIGGFGEVWKATNPHLPPVALKFCRDEDAVPLLRNETALLARVMREGRHPGIVQLLDTFLGADPPFLKFELVEGGDLIGLIRRWCQHGGPTTEQATHTLLRLAEIMSFAHRLSPPLVHRDLKPANILLQRSRTGEPSFKITDFGIGGLAMRGKRAALAASDAARGAHTPLYASPQQIRGKPADPRDDVHALGVIWYQLLVADLGVAPVPDADWQQELPSRGMSLAAISLLASCVAPDPSDRPADAGILVDRLRALLREDNATRERSRRKTAPAPSRDPKVVSLASRLPWISLDEDRSATGACPLSTAHPGLVRSAGFPWPRAWSRFLSVLMGALLLPVGVLVVYLLSSQMGRNSPEPFDRIQVGMSETEVREVLGEPTLCIQVPSQNRKELNWQHAEEVIAIDLQDDRVQEKRRTKNTGGPPMR